MIGTPLLAVPKGCTTTSSTVQLVDGHAVHANATRQFVYVPYRPHFRYLQLRQLIDESSRLVNATAVI